MEKRNDTITVTEEADYNNKMETMSFRNPYSGVMVELDTDFFLRDPWKNHKLWDHEEIKTLEKYQDCFYMLWRDFKHDENFRENMSNVEKAISYYYEHIHNRWLLDLTPEDETDVLNKFGYIIGLKQAIREGYALDKHEYWEHRPKEEQEELHAFMIKMKQELANSEQPKPSEV